MILEGHMVKGDVTGKLLDLLFIPVILHVMTEQDITDRIDGLESLGNNGKQCNDTGYLIDNRGKVGLVHNYFTDGNTSPGSKITGKRKAQYLEQLECNPAY